MPGASLWDVFLKLIPFLKGVVIYTIVSKDTPGYFAALIKCMPVVCLIIFVAWHGHELPARYTKFWHKILLGLFFSCFGDYCLVWDDKVYFLWGMVSFGVGHIYYITAFGFKPLNPLVGIVCYSLAGIGLYVLSPGLKDVMIVGVPVYTLLLTTMMWRAIARIERNTWSWAHIITAVGAVSFVISDLLIGLNLFREVEMPAFKALVMITYYFAQFGLALSVIDIVDKDD